MNQIERDVEMLVATIQGVLLSITAIALTLTVIAQIVHYVRG